MEENEMTKKRKNYTPEEKITILKKHLAENIPVSNLCDQYDLNPTIFYRWQKQFFEKGFLAFQNGKDVNTSKLEKKVNSLKNKSVTSGKAGGLYCEPLKAVKKPWTT